MSATYRVPGETFAGYTNLVVKTCGYCGVMFAIPQELEDECIRDHDHWWYCPNGHSRHYIGRTNEQKLRESLERERTRSGRLAAERDQIEARRRSQKAAHTRLKKRLANGVCPCCNRSFSDLHAHMESRHPDFVELQTLPGE